MMEAYNQPEDIADAAIHFALLAYAAEVASSRYVALLRRQRQPEEPKKPQKVSRKERRSPIACSGLGQMLCCWHAL